MSASLNLPALDASKSLFSSSHVSDVSLWTRPALVKVLPAIRDLSGALQGLWCLVEPEGYLRVVACFNYRARTSRVTCLN